MSEQYSTDDKKPEPTIHVRDLARCYRWLLSTYFGSPSLVSSAIDTSVASGDGETRGELVFGGREAPTKSD